MSKERDTLEVKTDAAIATGTPPEPTLTRDERKARLASVLDRGIVADRLKVDLPSNLHGEWVFNDPTEIFRMEALGFKIDDVHAPKRALHSKGDSGSVVGDVIFMVCERETKDMIDEIRREQYARLNSKGPKQKEEKDYNKMVDR